MPTNMLSYKQSYTTNGKVRNVELLGKDTAQLINTVLRFRTRRNLERATILQVTQDVALTSKDFSINQNKKAAHRPKKLTLDKVISGARALIDIIKGDVVTDKELQRRSAICADCPKISDVGGNCTGCRQKGLARYARSLAVAYGRNFTAPKILAKHTIPPKTGSLAEFYCTICGCSVLNLALSQSRHFLKKETTDRPNHCWAKLNGPNWKD